MRQRKDDAEKAGIVEVTPEKLLCGLYVAPTHPPHNLRQPKLAVMRNERVSRQSLDRQLI